jgi:hypothetical protein
MEALVDDVNMNFENMAQIDITYNNFLSVYTVVVAERSKALR